MVASTDPVRIVRIVARLNVGGPAQHVIWLSDGLRSQGFETQLICGTTPDGEDEMGWLADRYDIEPVVLPSMSREISVKDAWVVWQLYRRFLSYRPQIIHTHTAKAGTAGRVAAWLYKYLTPTTLIGRPRPVVVLHTFHGHIFHSYYSRFKTKIFLTIERMLARFATNKIVVISDQQLAEIHDEFRVGVSRDQFSVIRLGLDLNRLRDPSVQPSEFRSEVRAKDDQLVVGLIGRIAAVKNHDLFLQVADAIRQRDLGERFRFVVIGDGLLRSSLESRARELGLGDLVCFVGNRNDPERFYPALDIVALTSFNEGTPLSVIEGMASGKPVVSTRVGGIPDLVGSETSATNGYCVHERGITVDSEDLNGFVNGLVRLAEDKELARQLGEAGREFVDATYSKQRLIDDIGQLYQQLAGDYSNHSLIKPQEGKAACVS